MIGVLHRLDGTRWEFVKIEASGSGHNFQEARQLLHSHLHVVYPQEIIAMTMPHNMAHRYNMEKDDVYIISPEIKTVFLGLGWDAGNYVDVDASVSAYDAHLNHVTDVYYGHLNDLGMSHSGDNVTGEGAGDDERISINLQQIPSHIHHIASTITIFRGAQSFREVKNAYCRMVETQKNRELCRFSLSKSASEMSGMLMCVLSRHGINNWMMEVRGEPLSERTVVRCHYAIQSLLASPPHLRRVTTQAPTSIRSVSQMQSAPVISFPFQEVPPPFPLEPPPPFFPFQSGPAGPPPFPQAPRPTHSQSQTSSDCGCSLL